MLYKYNVNENPRYNIISVCKIYTLYIYIYVYVLQMEIVLYFGFLLTLYCGNF